MFLRLGVGGSQSRVVVEHKRLVGIGYGCAVPRPAALAASATFLHLVMIIRQSHLNEHRVAPVWSMRRAPRTNSASHMLM